MGDLEAGLLDWSKRQTAWQQDLLRRLVSGSTIGKQDLRFYADCAGRAEIEKEAPWFSKPKTGDLPILIPLDKVHLSSTEAGGDPVQIVKIVHVHGANDIADGASLEVDPKGLTIVAGKNGSGKSGYTRILKQFAASRASEDVLPNAYGSTQTPMAAVSFLVGNSSTQDLTWRSGADQPESPLKRVRVFDTRSASAHLAGATEIAYIPSTLQVLGEYTKILKEVEALIDNDLEAIRLQNRSWPQIENTDTSQILSRLGTPDALTWIQSVAELTTEELTELEELPARIQSFAASNPAALAVQARQRSSQLKILASSLKAIASKVSVEAISRSEKLIQDFQSARAKMQEAQDLIKQEGDLEGTGDEKWQELWLAAQAFSELDHEHPASDDQNELHICPLCQQTLQDSARDRFTRFANYMRGESQADLTTARKLRDSDVAALTGLSLDSLVTPELADLIGTYNEEVGQTILPAINETKRIRDHLLEPELKSDPFDPVVLAATFDSIIQTLQSAAKDEDAKAAELDLLKDSTDPAVQAGARLQELTFRRDFAKVRNDVCKQHDLSIRARCLEVSRRSCSTTSASRKNSELSSSYVNKVSDQFETETRKLGVSRVPVELIFDRSARGVSYIKINLKGADTTPVASVLSEGEQRVTAIAGFFADLTESGDFSTLVFDDPVSSLDQVFRVKVAQRLLEEAELRQVIVFTHDFTFVQYLYEEKKLRDILARSEGNEPAKEINYLHIERSSEGAGVTTTADEWRHVSVKERIGRIKQRIQASSAIHRKGDLTSYEAQARDIVGAIRDTWEAFVEQDLLNAVVTRHDRRVQTQRLAKLIDLTDSDIAVVELGMSIDSRFMTGHAAPISDGSAALSPEELTEEIQRLEELRQSINARRR